MSARRVTLQNNGSESFRAGVNRGGKSRWSSAHDRQIGKNFGFVFRRQRTQQSGHLRNFAQGRPPQRRPRRRDQRRQIAIRQAKAFAQLLALIARQIDHAMRNVILVEEIVDLMSVAIVRRGQDTEAGELAVTIQSPPPHNERVDDRRADRRYFGQGAPKLRGRDVENFRLVGSDARAGES